MGVREIYLKSKNPLKHPKSLGITTTTTNNNQNKEKHKFQFSQPLTILKAKILQNNNKSNNINANNNQQSSETSTSQLIMNQTQLNSKSVEIAAQNKQYLRKIGEELNSEQLGKIRRNLNKSFDFTSAASAYCRYKNKKNIASFKIENIVIGKNILQQQPLFTQPDNYNYENEQSNNNNIINKHYIMNHFSIKTENAPNNNYDNANNNCSNYFNNDNNDDKKKNFKDAQFNTTVIQNNTQFPITSYLKQLKVANGTSLYNNKFTNALTQNINAYLQQSKQSNFYRLDSTKKNLSQENITQSNFQSKNSQVLQSQNNINCFVNNEQSVSKKLHQSNILKLQSEKDKNKKRKILYSHNFCLKKSQLDFELAKICKTQPTQTTSYCQNDENNLRHSQVHNAQQQGNLENFPQRETLLLNCAKKRLSSPNPQIAMRIINFIIELVQSIDKLLSVIHKNQSKNQEINQEFALSNQVLRIKQYGLNVIKNPYTLESLEKNLDQILNQIQEVSNSHSLVYRYPQFNQEFYHLIKCCHQDLKIADEYKQLCSLYQQN